VCQIRTLRPPHGVPAWCRSGGTVRVTREEPCALPSTTATTS
jgi:hypothetical protein